MTRCAWPGCEQPREDVFVETDGRKITSAAYCYEHARVKMNYAFRMRKHKPMLMREDINHVACQFKDGVARCV